MYPEESSLHIWHQVTYQFLSLFPASDVVKYFYNYYLRHLLEDIFQIIFVLFICYLNLACYVLQFFENAVYLVTWILFWTTMELLFFVIVCILNCRVCFISSFKAVGIYRLLIICNLHYLIYIGFIYIPQVHSLSKKCNISLLG